MKAKILTTLAMAAAAVVVSAPLAHATSELELISGAASTIITGVNGYASYNGSLGVWNINVTTGLAAPADGIPGAPNIDLNSTDATSTGGTPLEILWSAGGYTSTGGIVAGIGGTLGAGVSVTFTGYYGSTVLSTANAINATLSMNTPGAFSGSDFGSVPNSATTPYFLTEVVTLNSIGGSQSSFDANLAVPDGGATLMLLGSAMTAMTLVRSKLGKLK